MTEQDVMPIQNFDYIEFYVGDARHTAYYFTHAWGFVPIAYAGLETGVRDRSSYVLEQGNIRLIITSALGPESEIAKHVHQHGDGVKDVAFRVDSAEQAYSTAISRGAQGVMEPTERRNNFGSVKLASIATYGETIHTFVERQYYQGNAFLPGFRSLESPLPRRARPAGLAGIDHVAGNVETGKIDEWIHFYEQIMGFTPMLHLDNHQTSTEYSSLVSRVMQNDSGRIKLSINEPAPDHRKSQIEEYLDFYRSPGVQHIALTTDDIISTAHNLSGRGVQFLHTPMSYYETLLERVGHIDENIKKLAELSILVDSDDEGYLLQIFSQPVVSRPTVFFEVIQRKGARNFG